MPSATMFLEPYMAHTYLFCMIDDFFRKLKQPIGSFWNTVTNVWECASLNWIFRKSCSSPFGINARILIILKPFSFAWSTITVISLDLTLLVAHGLSHEQISMCTACFLFPDEKGVSKQSFMDWFNYPKQMNIT